MKQNRGWILFFAVLTFGALLRLWQFGRIPEGFYSDEALYGYEAYSLYKTGKDQFGNRGPISIAGFGDYRPAFYIYSTIPFIATLGLTEFATRLPSVVSSLATLVVTFFFIRLICRSYKIALLSMVILALSPWSLYFARIAHETNLMTLLIITGIYFLWRSRSYKPFLILAAIFFSASLYTYHSARVFLPLFLVLVVIIKRNFLKRNLKITLISGFILILAGLPILVEYKVGEADARIQGVSLWNDPGIIPKINESRGKAIERGTNPFISRILYNKVTIYSLVFIQNWLSHFSPEFLLLQGDPNSIYNTPNTGILLWPESILILVGMYYLWQKKRVLSLWIGITIVLSLVPDALTRLAPSSARIHLALPFVAYISGQGMSVWSRKGRIWNLLLIVLIIGSSLWFWHNYLVTRPLKNYQAWQMGTKEMVLETQRLAPNYHRIWISRSGWGWIHILFHTKYDPHVFQKEVRVSGRNELGFWWVSDVGKYHLELLPDPFFPDASTLYIGTPGEFSTTVKPLHIIRDRYGVDRFWFVSTSYQ